MNSTQSISWTEVAGLVADCLQRDLMNADIPVLGQRVYRNRVSLGERKFGAGERIIDIAIAIPEKEDLRGGPTYRRADTIANRFRYPGAEKLKPVISPFYPNQFSLG